MPLVAWYRRDDEDEVWALEALFELDHEGNPASFYRSDARIPLIIVKKSWSFANKLTSRKPDLSKLEEIDPIDVPLLEMQLSMHQQERLIEINLQKPGIYFAIDASEEGQDAPRTVAYGRVVRVVEPRSLVEAVILGVQPYSGEIWQTLRPLSDPDGPRINTSESLVPGDHYLLKVGAKSMTDNISKRAAQEIREDYDNWIHVFDDELDAPDLPPSTFRRR